MKQKQQRFFHHQTRTVRVRSYQPWLIWFIGNWELPGDSNLWPSYPWSPGWRSAITFEFGSRFHSPSPKRSQSLRTPINLHFSLIPSWVYIETFGCRFNVHILWGKPGYMCATVKSRYIGDGHPTFNRNPSNGYINPYYWVDDHALLILLYGNNGSLDPGTCK